MTRAELLAKAASCVKLRHAEACEVAVACETGDGPDGRGCICGLNKTELRIATDLLAVIAPTVVDDFCERLLSDEAMDAVCDGITDVMIIRDAMSSIKTAIAVARKGLLNE